MKNPTLRLVIPEIHHKMRKQGLSNKNTNTKTKTKTRIKTKTKTKTMTC